MKTRLLSRYALSSCVAAAMLAGCGGSQPPIGVPGAMAQTSAVAMHSGRGTSWMSPEAKSEDLLYVTNYSEVLVFTYPQGKLVGTLKGFVSAVGECVDSKGNVFITNYNPVTVYEYAHGGKKPIAQFPTKKAGTIGCAINPVTGDLAITGQTSYVEIYRGAQQGKPIVFQDKGMFFGQFCTYDDKGNFFFLGLNPKENQRLSTLPSGASKFVEIKLDSQIQEDAGIQWDGKYLTALSYVPFSSKGKPELFQFHIINNVRGTKVGRMPLGAPAAEVLQYYITDGTAVVPNLRATTGQSSSVLLYNYPTGGSPYATITKGVTDARGVVVSTAH